VRNKHIGDSLDFAKRRLLELAGSLGLSTLVAPLPCQRNFQFDLYERMLGARFPHAVHGRDVVRFSGRNRARHLDDLRATIRNETFRAVLLDPDSGLRQDHENDSRYLSSAEVRWLVNSRPLTWLLYHHQSTGRLAYDDVIASLGAAGAYDLGKAAVVIGGPAGQTTRFMGAICGSLNPEHWIRAMDGSAPNSAARADC